MSILNKYGKLRVACLAGLFIAGSTLFAQGWDDGEFRPSTKTRERHKWENRHGGFFSFMRRPAKDTPDAQLDYAERLREAGRLRRASNMYKALLRVWPKSPEAPAAQLALAEVLEERGKLNKSFDEYQYLIEAYAGFFPYDKVVERQMRIALDFADQRRWFLFIPYKAPGDAVGMFEQVVENAPHAAGADRMQLKVADLYYTSGQYEFAIEAYLAAMQRYPLGELAEEAAYGYAMSYLGLSEKYPNSSDFRENAVQALAVFVRRYPDSNRAVQARLDLKKIRAKQAQMLYTKARTYDKRRKRPKSALVVYEQLVQEYPESKWVEPARVRIAQIRRKHGDVM